MLQKLQYFVKTKFVLLAQRYSKANHFCLLLPVEKMKKNYHLEEKGVFFVFQNMIKNSGCRTKNVSVRVD